MNKGIDDVYAAPLDEFVSRRNTLARTLKDAGDEAGAAAVKGLKKPSVSAWVVNQFAHHHAGDLQDLIDAAEAMESEQRKSLAGEVVDLSAAKGREQEAITRLRQIAVGEVMPAITSPTLERVTNTLLNGARSSDGRSALAGGRLEADLEPPGFDAYVGFNVPAPPTRTQRKTKPTRLEPSEQTDATPPPANDMSDTDHPDPEIGVLEAQVEGARQAARAARAEADEAAGKAAEAKELADQLANQASEALRRADDAQDELEKLQAQIEASRS